MWWALSSRLTIRRRSAFVVESQAVAASLTIARQPPRESLLEVTVSGGSGTVTVVGTSDGSSTSEVLTFDGTGRVKQTTRLYTAYASISLVGFVGQTVAARAIGRDGSPQPTSAVLTSGWPASLEEGDPSRPAVSLPGRTEDGTGWWTVAYSETFAPRAGDFFDDELGRRWEVVGVPRPGGGNFAGPHWLVRTQRREGDA